MNIDENTINRLRIINSHAQLCTDFMHFLIQKSRVTHTAIDKFQENAHLLLKNCIRILNIVDNHDRFIHDIKTALFHSQVGPTELVINEDEIYINGTFNIESLRSLICACEPAPTMTAMKKHAEKN